jgi:hypothetical protein
LKGRFTTNFSVVALFFFDGDLSEIFVLAVGYLAFSVVPLVTMITANPGFAISKGIVSRVNVDLVAVVTHLVLLDGLVAVLAKVHILRVDAHSGERRGLEDRQTFVTGLFGGLKKLFGPLSLLFARLCAGLTEGAALVVTELTSLHFIYRSRTS